MSPFAPRKHATFAERRATIVRTPILDNGSWRRIRRDGNIRIGLWKPRTKQRCAGFDSVIAAAILWPPARLGRQERDPHDRRRRRTQHRGWPQACIRASSASRSTISPAGYASPVTTYPLNRSHKPTGNAEQDQAVVYDPAKAWDASPLTMTARRSEPFAGYVYLTDHVHRFGRRRHGPGHRPEDLQQRHQLDRTTNQPMRGQTIAEIAKAGQVGGRRSPPCRGATPRPPDSAAPTTSAATTTPRSPTRCSAPPWLDVHHGRGQSRFRRRRPARSDKPENRDYQYVGGQETWEQLKSGKHPAVEADREQGGFRGIGRRLASYAAEGAGHGPGGHDASSRTAAAVCRRGRANPRSAKSRSQHPLNDNVPSLAVMSQGGHQLSRRQPQRLLSDDRGRGGRLGQSRQRSRTA